MAKGHVFERKDYGKWDVWRNSYGQNELMQRRARLAKVANSRLLNLERSKSYITDSSLIEASQFDTTLEYLESRGLRRFSESKTKKMGEYELRHEITLLENFLDMKTSTVTGYRDVERKRVNKFISKGVPEAVAKSKEFYDFLNSETFETLTYAALDSDDIIDDIGKYTSPDSSNLQKILDAFEVHKSHQEEGHKALLARLDAITLSK